MNLKVGIVGLPNAGKSTLFNALLQKQQALAANYPFATIEPNVGIVGVPDNRLGKLAEIVKTEKIVPSTVEFVDIAGLVKGAHKGEGLGNKFLAHIREVNLIVLVLRVFEDKDVVVTGSGEAEDDYQTLMTELELADLTTEEKSKLKGQERMDLPLLTAKPKLILLNLGEDQLREAKFFEEKYAHLGEVMAICAKTEADLADFVEADKKSYLKDLGVEDSGLNKLIKLAFEKLSLISFLTAGEKEVRSWTISKGTLAPQAAGVIHTDFEAKFIKAQVCNYEDFVAHNGWNGAKAAGKVRSEGRDYVMDKDDVVEFMISR